MRVQQLGNRIWKELNLIIDFTSKPAALEYTSYSIHPLVNHPLQNLQEQNNLKHPYMHARGMAGAAPEAFWEADTGRGVVNLSIIDVAGKESANLTCSQCGISRKIVVPKQPNRFYKVTCRCMNKFLIELNRRKHRRVQTDFMAIYSLKHNFVTFIIDIVDLSKGGLGFIRTDVNKLSISGLLKINFSIDNAEHDVIECTSIIRNVHNNRVCVEFLNMGGRDKTILGFYFYNP